MTEEYRAPEMEAGSGAVDYSRADTYGAGKTLHTWLKQIYRDRRKEAEEVVTAMMADDPLERLDVVDYLKQHTE